MPPIRATSSARTRRVRYLLQVITRARAADIRVARPFEAAVSRIDDTSRLYGGEISRRGGATRRGAPRETNRNLDVYDACDCHRQARTIGPRANARFNCK